MSEIIITHSDNSYGIENFSEITREIIRETENLFNNVYLKENCSDHLFITEATENNKNILIEALKKLIAAITALSRKFMTLANKLITKNKAWLAKVKAKSAIGDKVPDNFKAEVYPYWRGEDKLRNYRFPEFRETPEFLEELKDVESFKQKYFKDLYITENGKTEFNPKAVFQGGTKKVVMNKKMFLEQYPNMVKYVESYAELARSINTRNNKIIEFLNNSIRKIRSAVFRESNEFLDTVNMLLEQDGPVTSNTVDKQEQPSGSDDPNKPDKREEGKDPNQITKNMVNAREQYNRIVYSINSARMGVAESCYNAYVRLIHSAIKITSEDEEK